MKDTSLFNAFPTPKMMRNVFCRFFFCGAIFSSTLLTSACQSVARYGTPAEMNQTPTERTASALAVEEGMASYYAEAFHGKKTASGELYDMNQLTAASVSLPFGKKVRVTNLENGKSTVLTINDRMPKNSKGRIIDVSLSAAKALDMVRTGLAKVKVEILE
jgi:rare lipoprotein A